MKKLVITRRGRREESLDGDAVAARKAQAESVRRKAEIQAIINQRRAEYGSAEQQLEYLVEHGLEAFMERQRAIKATFPKPESESGKPKKKARKK